jgi:GDP-mannose 6-dehydrogenase
MKISVFGLGYVGCVTAACLANDGHTVIGVDINPRKVEQIQSGKAPVLEPGLEKMIQDGLRTHHFQATVNNYETILNSDVSLICVGTPSSENGSLDLGYVKKVCVEIGQALAVKPDYHVVVIRSTVLPGTVQDLLIPILEKHSGRKAGADFGVCMNPEFLREGSAIEDYYHPSQIVIGEYDPRSGDVVQALYHAVDAPVVRVVLPVAEMVKYVSNTWHALKVAFANEIGNLSKAHNIDGQEVMQIFVQDRQLNISPTYLRPGFAFGGSCLPKDVRALRYRAKERDLALPILEAIMNSNEQQIQRGIKMVEKTGRKKVGVLGLSFKNGTDDVRESPVVPLVETLVGRGYQVSIYDEQVVPDNLIGANRVFLEREIPHVASLMRCCAEDVINEAEVVVITNGSASFRDAVKQVRSDQVVIDLVGIAKNGQKEGYEGICW